jgi:hypothetical protein
MQARSALAALAAERFHFAAVLMLFIAAVGASCARDGVDGGRRSSNDQHPVIKCSHSTSRLPAMWSGYQNGLDHELAPSVTALHSSCAAQRSGAVRVSQGRPLGFLATQVLELPNAAPCADGKGAKAI